MLRAGRRLGMMASSRSRLLASRVAGARQSPDEARFRHIAGVNEGVDLSRYPIASFPREAIYHLVESPERLYQVMGKEVERPLSFIGRMSEYQAVDMLRHTDRLAALKGAGGCEADHSRVEVALLKHILEVGEGVDIGRHPIEALSDSGIRHLFEAPKMLSQVVGGDIERLVACIGRSSSAVFILKDHDRLTALRRLVTTAADQSRVEEVVMKRALGVSEEVNIACYPIAIFSGRGISCLFDFLPNTHPLSRVVGGDTDRLIACIGRVEIHEAVPILSIGRLGSLKRLVGSEGDKQRVEEALLRQALGVEGEVDLATYPIADFSGDGVECLLKLLPETSCMNRVIGDNKDRVERLIACISRVKGYVIPLYVNGPDKLPHWGLTSISYIL